MLEPQPHGELLLQPDSPPVFGKPWYWQRSSGTMESTRSLAQVIMEMRDEIKKLEEENRELRGDGQRAFGARSGGTGGLLSPVPENPYVNLRRNVSAPVLEGQYKDNSVMTVRRYSISSNLSGVTLREGRADRQRQGDTGWRRLQEEVEHGTRAVRGEVAKATNRHSLQEYVQKNRTKVKTVTFLLPVDDIYTNRPVLTRHQEEKEEEEEEEEEPKLSQLASITETES